MASTLTAALTYDIGEGEYGRVTILCRGRVIATRLKKTVLRQDRESEERMAEWDGAGQWRWLGVEADRLPAGVTLADVRMTYLIARDEMMDAGLALASYEQ